LAELRQLAFDRGHCDVIVVGTSIVLRRYLPKAPVFNKMVLEPTSEEDLIDLDYRESLVDYSHPSRPKSATAATNLMPSGQADFNGQLVDVITEGLPIDRGTSVVVAKTRGNRVMVRRADADDELCLHRGFLLLSPNHSGLLARPVIIRGTGSSLSLDLY